MGQHFVHVELRAIAVVLQRDTGVGHRPQAEGGEQAGGAEFEQFHGCSPFLCSVLRGRKRRAFAMGALHGKEVSRVCPQ
ncbi:hypothetical protein FQZ97_1185900 [compost metagenome]